MQRIEDYEVKKEILELDTAEAHAAYDVDQDMIHCVMCGKSFLGTEALANHVSAEHSAAHAIEGCELWPRSQTHINYYDECATVKMEFHENKIQVERKEVLFSLQPSSMTSSCSKESCDTVISVETCSQLKRKEIDDSAPQVKKIKTKKISNEMYEDKKTLVYSSLQTIQNLVEVAVEIDHGQINTQNYLLAQDITQAEDKLFACNICGYTCGYRSNLRRHMKTHSDEKPFSCHFCDYKCKNKSHLKQHIRNHTGDKPFACSFCDYKSINVCHLNQHIRKHSGDKPFACGLCDWKFSSKSYLNSHFRTHTDEKPFACDICNYKCRDKCNLKRHVQTHAHDQSFCCNFCPYKCKNKSRLNQHIRTHPSEKNFVCDICNNKYTSKSNLNQHARTHTGEKPFSCGLCDYKSCHNSSLRRHLNTHTSKKSFA